MSRPRWNPNGHPSPRELGYFKGQRVVQHHNGIAYPGTVVHVYPQSIVVKDDRNGMMIQCHPHGTFSPLLSQEAGDA